MEQRDHRQPDLLHRSGRLLAAAKGCESAIISARHDVRAQISVRAQRALGLPRGPAGVEDRCLVIRSDFDLGQFGSGQRAVIARCPDNVLEPLAASGFTARDEHGFQFGQVAAMRNDPLPSFGIADQKFTARIGQSERQFGPGPPGVERHADRSDRRGGEKGHRPFGQVAHGERHTVALLHPARTQFRSQPGDRAEPAFVAYPFVFVDREGALAMRTGKQRHLPEVRRGVLPNACRHPANIDGFHLEALARCSQALDTLRSGHGRPARRRHEIDRTREVVHGIPLILASAGESLSNVLSKPAWRLCASRLRSKGMRVARTDEIAIRAKQKHRYARRGER